MSEVAAASTSTDTSSTDSSDSGLETSLEGGEVSAKPTIQAMKELFKLKVDGEDVEEELDWNDKDTIRNKLQLAHAAKKRMSEAVEAKRKAYDIVKQFDEDPSTLLQRLGPKGREIAEKYLLAQIQDDMLSPEEKEYRATKAELAALRKEKEDAAENVKKTAMEKKEFEYAQNFQNTIIQALNKSGLPKTPELVKRMASLMSKNLDLGLELTPDDLVSDIKSELTGILKSVIGDSDGEHLINLLGADAAKKLRTYDVKNLQEKQERLVAKPRAQDRDKTKTNTNAKGWTSIEEWKEQLNERIKD